MARIPPQSVDSERQVLGSMLVDQQTSIVAALDILSTQDFYRGSHQKIFSVMSHLYEKGDAIDLVSVSEELRKRDWLEDAGGVAYLTELARDMVAGLNIESHARTIQDKNILRQVIEVCEDGRERAYRDQEDTGRLLDLLEQRFLDIKSGHGTSEFTTLENVLGGIDYSTPKVFNARTFIREIDYLLLGYEPGTLNLLAARPSVGKTALALQIALGMIMKKRGVAFFSIEMYNEQLGDRIIPLLTGIPHKKIRMRHLSPDELTVVKRVKDDIPKDTLHLLDIPTITSTTIRSKLRNLQGQHKIELVVIDYLGLITPVEKRENRQVDVSDISASLKNMAKTIGLPVLLLCQLNRNVDNRTEKRPILTDLRESGSLEQDADTVMFIHRPDYEQEKTSEVPVSASKTEIILAKNRNGEVGTVKMLFMPGTGKFEVEHV